MQILFLFSLFIPLSVTIATPPTFSSPSTSLIHRNSSVSSSSSHTTHIPFVHPTTHTNSIQFISRPTLVTHTRNPSTTYPVHTRTARPTNRFQANQKPINIAFEALGGILVVGMLLGFLRCCYNYKKTPRRDRIADVLRRHHLQRELEELERNPVSLRRPFLREPAPPYFPRPPSYEQINSTHQGTAPPRADYSAVPTHSPSPSPPLSQRTPLPTHPVGARPLPDLIPPMPSG